jgi:hypothetical protein
MATDVLKEALHRPFDHWMETPEWVSEQNGHYYQ